MTNELWKEEIMKLTGKELSLADAEVFNTQLAALINELVNKDFDKLISILYRLDVSEQKLKTMLGQHTTEDAGVLIAAAIIERQQQKAASRQQFSKPASDIPDDEKW